MYDLFIFVWPFSIELSELELPDVTIANTASTAKRLNRKRPRHSLNVTAFEKRLKDRDGEIETIKDGIQYCKCTI